MRYNIGDLLVKRHGKSKIILIIDVQPYMEDTRTGKQHYNLGLLDMCTDSSSYYDSVHVDSWLHSMYKHYPVKL